MKNTVEITVVEQFVTSLVMILKSGRIDTMYIEGLCAGFQMATGTIVYISGNTVTIFENADMNENEIVGQWEF